MKISTNLGTAPDGKVGISEGSKLIVRTDEECIFITMVLLKDAKIIKNRLIGTPEIVNQLDYVNEESILLKRWMWNLKGNHTLKVVAWGTHSGVTELDTDFEIY